MKRAPSQRRRPAVHITLGRASRLHRFVTTLTAGPRTRESLLSALGIGLRTFYRELELLKRCGIRIRLSQKQYRLYTTAEESEGRLPFPDPQLSFSEMAELAQGVGPAAARLAGLLESVIGQPAPKPPKRSRGSRGKSS
jgi:predicted DNA-binding transcriptional regulator YafY